MLLSSRPLGHVSGFAQVKLTLEPAFRKQWSELSETSCLPLQLSFQSQVSGWMSSGKLLIWIELTNLEWDET